MELFEKIRLRSAKRVKKEKFISKMIQITAYYNAHFKMANSQFIFKALPSRNIVINYNTQNGKANVRFNGTTLEFPDITTF